MGLNTKSMGNVASNHWSNNHIFFQDELVQKWRQNHELHLVCWDSNLCDSCHVWSCPHRLHRLRQRHNQNLRASGKIFIFRSYIKIFWIQFSHCCNLPNRAFRIKKVKILANGPDVIDKTSGLRLVSPFHSQMVGPTHDLLTSHIRTGYVMSIHTSVPNSTRYPNYSTSRYSKLHTTLLTNDKGLY